MSPRPEGFEPRSPEERRRRGGRAAPADAWGIVPGHEDAFGNWTDVPRTTRDALVEAMGGDPTTEGPTEVACPLRVVRADETDLEVGYHELEEGGRQVTVAVTPDRCFLPDGLRASGLAVQLYAAASSGSWGIGDLADLRSLGTWVRDAGGAAVLINPIDAVNPVRPRETSPYFPSTRRFRDPVYLRVEEVPGADGVGDVLPGLAAATRTADGSIDRDAVYVAKMRALERIWLTADGAGEEPGLRAFRDDVGPALDRFATFLAIAEVQGSGWRSWPDALAAPGASGVAAFATEHADRIRFHAWVQWLLDEQLRRAGAACGVVRDLPIGFDPDGFDAWDWQELLAEGITVGAPPDELGPQGQDWSLPAFVPWKLRAAGYRPFIETVRSAFRHAAGLRIDHVLGLFRLFWIPPAGTAADGAYVRQDHDVLLDLLALESHLAGAYVVGEDLGTVEEGVRPELLVRDLLRYQVWWFEDEPVAQWEPQALASVSTHDLPTIAGLWTGSDAEEQHALGLEPDENWLGEVRRRMEQVTGLPADAEPGEVSVALHREVASAPNALVLAQLDDAIAEPRRTNVPGTDRTQRDNWSRLLSVRVDELPDHELANRVLAAMADARR